MNLRLAVALVSVAAMAAVGACDKGGKPTGRQVAPAQPPAPASAHSGAPAAAPAAAAGNAAGTATAKAAPAPAVRPAPAARPAPARPGAAKPARPAPNARKARPAPRPAPAKAKATPAQTAAAKKFPLPVKGAKNPRVEILEWSDFQCPFCNRVNPTIKKIMETYGDDVAIKFLHNALPFHKDARPAAMAASAAQKQGKFWEMHDKLFANMRALKPNNLEAYAKELGLNMAKFKKDMNDPVLGVVADRQQAIAQAVGARGTPGFFVNGKSLRGAQPFDKFKAIIDQEIKASKDAKQRGPKWIASRLKANNAKLHGFVYGGQEPPAVPSRANNNANKRKPRPVDKTVYKVTYDPKKDAMKGDHRKALVTLIEFSDFQCPFCNRLNPSLNKVMETYGDKVAIVFKHNPLPFHKDAPAASQAALCAKDFGKFWEMHDKLFANMKALKPDNLKAYAAEILGPKAGAWQKCFDAGKYKAQIAADQELAGKVTARGTPNTFVNGRKMTGAKPFEEFKTIIDEEMKKAEALVKKGTPVAKVYAEIIKNGKVFEPLDAKVNDFKFDKNTSALGDPNKAKIVITEFSDFQCPFCSRVGKPLKDVKKHYGDKAAIVFKHFPLSFHKEAMPASQAALCAQDQGKFWEMHDEIFANQKQLKGIQTAKFVEWATKVGVKNIGAFTKCLESGAKKAQVDAEMAEGRKSGVRGTPSVYINGRKFTSPSGYNLRAFTSVIDKYILKAAK